MGSFHGLFYWCFATHKMGISTTCKRVSNVHSIHKMEETLCLEVVHFPLPPFCDLSTHISLSSFVDSWKWPSLFYFLAERHREDKYLNINSSKEILNSSVSQLKHSTFLDSVNSHSLYYLVTIWTSLLSPPQPYPAHTYMDFI